MLPNKTPDGALPASNASTEQVDNLNTISLALQRLITARQAALTNSDTALANQIGDKITEILARI